MHWHHQWCSSPIFMRWSVHLSFQNRWSHSQSWWGASFQHSFKCNYAIKSVRSHSHVSEGNPSWRYEDILWVQRCSSIAAGIVFEQHCPQSWSKHARSSVYNQMAFVIARNDFNQLRQLIVWFFLCPQLIRILLVFLLKIHWIASRWSTFQGVSRNVDVILVKDFANSIDVLIWQSFLFWNQISYFKNHVYSKSSCWNEIREISVLKIKLFGQRPNTRHSKYAILWLSYILKT